MSNEKLIEFFASWIANSVVLLAASMIFVGNVVLGNDKVSMPMAAVIAGFTLTVALTLVGPALDRSGYKVRDPKVLAVVYLAANLLILWVIKRFALVLGLGISNLMYVAIVGAALMLVQWGVMRVTKSISKS
ncbi:MAG: hypothetical protein WD988_02620 [Candidatus Curtissbacteria bacterium]